MVVKESNAPVKIKATVMWASLNKVNPMSNDYQVELTELSPQAVNALEEIGLEAHKNPDKPEKGFYIRCKSKYPIKALDSDGELITSSVGNGSKAVAVIGVYDWVFKNKKGKSPSLKKLVITELKKYEVEEDTVDTSELEEAL